MHKIAVLNDVLEVSDMLAVPLRDKGYEVMIDLTSIDFERVLAFRPELIILGLHRRVCAFDRPIKNLEADMFGFKPLVDMEHYPAISVIPILLLSTGIKEQDIPTSINYDSFLTIPEEATLYFAKVKELLETVKSRRKISAHICPHCGSRLTFTAAPAKELFCPRCHTSVVLVDSAHCLVTEPGELHSRPYDLSFITPHQGETSDQAEERATDRSKPA